MVNNKSNFPIAKPSSRTISTLFLVTLLFFSYCLGVMFLSLPSLPTLPLIYLFLHLSHTRAHTESTAIYIARTILAYMALSNRRKVSKQNVLALEIWHKIAQNSTDS